MECITEFEGRRVERVVCNIVWIETAKHLDSYNIISTANFMT
jgi:hypothetical protein